MLKPGKKLQQLKDLKTGSKKIEYLDVARALEGYGTVVFPHCPCDARRNGHVITTICLRNFQMKACTEEGETKEQEHSFNWEQIIQWDLDTEAMAFCFEYKKGENLRWVKIFSQYYEYMTECVDRVMQEIEWNNNDGVSPVLPGLPEQNTTTDECEDELSSSTASKPSKPPSSSRSMSKSGKASKRTVQRQPEVFCGTIEDDDL